MLIHLTLSHFLPFAFYYLFLYIFTTTFYYEHTAFAIGLKKNIQIGLRQLDDVVGTRTIAIQRQLRNVETLPALEVAIELPGIIFNTNEDEKENKF